MRSDAFGTSFYDGLDIEIVPFSSACSPEDVMPSGRVWEATGSGESKIQIVRN